MRGDQVQKRNFSLAVALVLVAAMFSFYLSEDITGQATSSTMERWRSEGLTEDWRRQFDDHPSKVAGQSGWRTFFSGVNSPVLCQGQCSPGCDNSKGSYCVWNGKKCACDPPVAKRGEPCGQIGPSMDDPDGMKQVCVEFAGGCEFGSACDLNEFSPTFCTCA